MTTEPQKKAQRGKRGGKKAKERLAATKDQATERADTVAEREVADSVESTTMPVPAKKKTRRGLRGKKAPAAEATGANSVELGFGAALYVDQEPANDTHTVRPFFGVLSPDEHQYFVAMEKELEEKEFEEEEERALFIQAMFREVEGKELLVAADPDCSRILEKLLRSSDDIRLRFFTSSVVGQYAELFRHQFASHVCQTILYLAAEAVDRESKGECIARGENDDEMMRQLPTMAQLILDICEELKGIWSSLIADSYASHVFRTILMVLSGKPLSENDSNMRSKKSQKYNHEHNNAWRNPRSITRAGSQQRTVPPSFMSMLMDITQDVVDHLTEPNLRAYAMHPVANPALQLLVSFENTGDALINALLNITDADNNILERDSFVDELMHHQVGSHLMEKILGVSRPHLFHQLYVVYFRSRLMELCEHRVANFVVQQLILHTRNGTQLEVLLDELKDHFESLLMNQRAGIIVKIVEMSAHHGACQKDVVKALCKALHANTTEERKKLINLLLYMRPIEKFRGLGTPNLHGSLIIQQLLLFDEENNKIVVDGFMSLPADECLGWAQGPVSSRILEQFLIVPTVSVKAKRKVIRRWLGSFGEMACDRNGGHVVDKCWAVADIGLKEKIAEDLLAHYNTLSNNQYGKFILRNCKIDNFKRKREEWLEKEMGIERKKEMFNEFLGDAGERDVRFTGVDAGSGRPEPEEDPLWSTHKFDEGMAALGFGRETRTGMQRDGSERDKTTKKKGKKERKSDVVHDMEEAKKMSLDDDDAHAAFSGQTHSLTSPVSKESKDEIENLFKNTKKRKRLGADAGLDSADASELMETISVTPVNKKINKELCDVLEAISATKRKKGKGKAKAEDKSGSKKRRKFEG